MIKRKHGFSRIDLYMALGVIALIASVLIATEHSNARIVVGRSVAVERR